MDIEFDSKKEVRTADRFLSPGGTIALCFLLLSAVFGQSVEAEGNRDSEYSPLAGRHPVEHVAASLRPAIRDLMETFGREYPRGDAFLLRLDAIQERFARGAHAFDELLALQREALLANPLVSGRPILYVVRHQYNYDHHNTHNFAPDAKNEFNQGEFRPGGALKTIDFGNGGKVATLLDVPDGVIRDPRVRWDGERVLFSMRQHREDSYHIYEINKDGTGLTQLTFLEDVDDIHPLYLPNGDIVFSSTREPKYCMCNRHIMGNIYRMEADGANIHQITKNTLFDRPNDIMPDGSILYDRWEYVDRNFGDAQALWTVNPDGTNQAIYWGNNTPSPGAVIDARSIPGTELAVAVFSSCHDLSWGALAIIDRRLGLDGRGPVRRIWPENAMERVRDPGAANNVWDDFVSVTPKYKDPCPLNDTFFLVSRLTRGSGQPHDHDNRTGIFLLDIFGNELLLHEESPGCFNPMPVTRRSRPPESVYRRDFEDAEGYFYVQDVYEGAYMAGVERGAVKYLRVVESPEKRYWVPGQWNAQGQTHPGVNWHSFETKRILGTVPVEEDGSAYFAVPSDTFLYFQLLDEKGMMVQSMRSGTVAQSGELLGCIGCHDDRRMAPPTATGRMPEATRRSPDTLTGWRGAVRMFDYMTEVQPVFDEYCVRCHDFGEPAGETLILAPDRNLIYNTSYNELWRKRYINVVGGGPAEVQPAYSWGSHASPLVRVLLNEHDTHEPVELPPEAFDRIVAWIDMNAVFYPDYSTSYPTHPGGRSPIDHEQTNKLGALTGWDLNQQFGHNANQGPLVTFDRPEMSPILSAIKDSDPSAYREALEIIELGKEAFAANPDVGMDGYVISGIDLWREEKYQERLKIEQQNREAIRRGEQRYDWQLTESAASDTK